MGREEGREEEAGIENKGRKTKGRNVEIHARKSTHTRKEGKTKGKKRR